MSIKTTKLIDQGGSIQKPDKGLEVIEAAKEVKPEAGYKGEEAFLKNYDPTSLKGGPKDYAGVLEATTEENFKILKESGSTGDPPPEESSSKGDYLSDSEVKGTIEEVLGENEWDKKAERYSETYYQQLSEEAKAEYSTKAAELDTVRNENQEAIEMQKYTNAQTTDKLGWTGGYVLDQQRQMEVLRAGIQAQLFNQQELNKLGLTSQLAAARLNADLKNQELAHQYYVDAENIAINRANTTGYYLSAEAEDYLTQKRAAEQMLTMYPEGSDKYKQAQNVIAHVNKYFKDNNLSEAGQKIASVILAEMELEANEWTQKVSLITALKNSDAYKEGSVALVYDEGGNVMFTPDGLSPVTISYSSINNTELKEYSASGKNNHLIEQTADYRLQEIGENFDKYCTDNNISASKEAWESFINGTGKTLIDAYNKLFDGIDTDYKVRENCTYSAGEDMTQVFTINSDLSFKVNYGTLTDDEIQNAESIDNSDIDEKTKQDQIAIEQAKKDSANKAAATKINPETTTIYDTSKVTKILPQTNYSTNGIHIKDPLQELYETAMGSRGGNFATFSDRITSKTTLTINDKNIDININFLTLCEKEVFNPQLTETHNELMEIVPYPSNGTIVTYNNKTYMYYKGDYWKQGLWGEITTNADKVKKALTS